MNQSSQKNGNYCIIAHPHQQTAGGYYFIIKNKVNNQLVKIRASKLLTNHKDILSQMSEKETNQIHYFYGLEEAELKYQQKQFFQTTKQTNQTGRN